MAYIYKEYLSLRYLIASKSKFICSSITITIFQRFSTPQLKFNPKMEKKENQRKALYTFKKKKPAWNNKYTYINMVCLRSEKQYYYLVILQGSEGLDLMWDRF